MLPTRHVVEVLEVAVKIYVDEDPQVIDSDTYDWYEAGWIQPTNWNLWPSAGGGYYYGYGPSFVPVYQAGIAKVTFKHGWDVLPDDIKEVVMELAAQAAVLGSSQHRRGGLPRLQVEAERRRDGDVTGQRNRLASYRIGATA